MVGEKSPFHSLSRVVSEIACLRQFPCANVLRMDDLDPRILDRAKKDFGDDCELIRTTDWSYSFKCGQSYCSISRFIAEEGFEVSATEIREQWPRWNQRQRTDFVSNWHAKGTWTVDDTEILEIIMADGDDNVWQTCTQAFLKHPDRNRVVSFLVDRVLHYTLQHEPLNYFQVLGIAKDERALAAIEPFHEKYKKIVDTESLVGVPDDVFWGPIPYFPYLVTAGALFKITGAIEYKQSIRKFLDHDNAQVRYWAEHELGIEGPTTAKRTAEYNKKRENP